MRTFLYLMALNCMIGAIIFLFTGVDESFELRAIQWGTLNVAGYLALTGTCCYAFFLVRVWRDRYFSKVPREMAKQQRVVRMYLDKL